MAAVNDDDYGLNLIQLRFDCRSTANRSRMAVEPKLYTEVESLVVTTALQKLKAKKTFITWAFITMSDAENSVVIPSPTLIDAHRLPGKIGLFGQNRDSVAFKTCN